MKLLKINTDETYDVKIKEVRLPMENEYQSIIQRSFLYQGGDFNYNFFKSFTRDEDKFEEYGSESEYDPAYRDLYDCEKVDLIPVIEIEEELESNSIYLTNNNVPFMCIEKNRLLCLSRVNYINFGFFDDMEYSDLCSFIDEGLDKVRKF